MKKWMMWLAVPAALFIGFSGGIATQVEEPEIQTVTETETVEVAPEACLQAIGWGEEIAQVGSDFAGIVGAYPDLVSESFQAGVDAAMYGDTTRGDEVLADMKSSNRELNDLLGRTETVVAEFNRTKAECREAAK